MKKKRTKKYGKDLNSEADLHGLFDPTGKQENFEGIFEKTVSDEELKAVLQDKKAVDEDRRHSHHERLKLYPDPEIELDLHGLTAAEAETRIESFLKNAKARGIRTVRIITGKGLHSPQGRAILPEVATGVIRRLKEEKIASGFRWEGKQKENSGSMRVYLAA